MKSIKPYVLFGLLLIISVLFVNGVAAEENNLKISLHVYEPTSGNDIFDYNKDILLSLKIINNYNYWVSIGSNYNKKPQLNLEIKNKDENIIYGDFFANTILIPPNSEIQIIIPFKYYNDMKIEERIDSWNIKPQLTFGSINYYNEPFEATQKSKISINAPSSNSPIVGNILAFSTEDPNAELNAENNEGNEFAMKVTNYLSKEEKTISDELLIGIFLIIAAIIIGGLWKLKGRE